MAPHERIENTPGVNKAETKPAQAWPAMTISRSSLTRRSALRLGALGLGAMGLGGLVLSPVAMAQTSVQWPLRLAYARISPAGFVQRGVGFQPMPHAAVHSFGSAGSTPRLLRVPRRVSDASTARDAEHQVRAIGNTGAN